MSFTASLNDIVEANENGLLGKHPSWQRIPLGQVATVLNGFAFSSSFFSRTNGVPLLRIRDVTSTATEALYSGEYDEEYLVNPGELVVGMDGNFNAAIWNGPTALLNQRVCKLAPDARFFDRRFLSYLLPGYLKAINDETSSVTVKHLSSRTVQDIPLPLPPTNEQKQIADTLDTFFTDLDSAVAALKRVQANLKRYRASVLKAACEGRLVPTEAELARKEGRTYETGEQLLARILKERRAKWEADQLAKTLAAGKDPKDDTWKKIYKEPAVPERIGLPELAEGWSVASLEQLTSAVRVICYGILMPKDNVADGILYVRVKDMKRDSVDVHALHRTAPDIAAEYARASLKTGDLLLAIRGTYGRVAEVPPELDGGNITQDTVRVDVNAGVSREYVATFLRSADVQNYFKRVARGVAVKGVNVADVRTCPVLLPPFDEQRRISQAVAAQISVIEEIATEIDRNVKRADRLRQAILKRAFEGKLVPQDPTTSPHRCCWSVSGRNALLREMEDRKRTRTARDALPPPRCSADERRSE